MERTRDRSAGERHHAHALSRRTGRDFPTDGPGVAAELRDDALVVADGDVVDAAPPPPRSFRGTCGELVSSVDRAMKMTLADAATVTGPEEFQAQAKAVSARRKT